MRLCMKRFSRIPVKNVLEIACGPAPHAGELIRHGFKYSGFDINHKMLDYAHTAWRDIQPKPELIQADMVDFNMEHKADFAFVMIGSLYLKSEDDLRTHFDGISKSLRPGGLYFMDWCLQFFDPTKWDERLTFRSEKDGIKLQSRFHVEQLSTGRNMYKETWTIDVDDHGEHHQMEMIERNLALFPEDFGNFVQGRDDFEFVGWWSDWDLNKPIDVDSEIRRPLVILRRTNGSSSHS